MDDINVYTGKKIRNYRKMRKMTLQMLADRIYKSRATVSKYETGEIVVDIETLWKIAEALGVSLSQLADYHPEVETEHLRETPDYDGESPFFRADRLWFYYMDGRYNRLKEAIIDIHRDAVGDDGCVEATMSIRSTTPTGRSSEIYYVGSVLYSDMLIRFSFTNQYNRLEEDLLYIFNPLELRDYTEGLLCGISSTDMKPCAFKCIVALQPSDDYIALREHLSLTQKELRRWQKMNMFIVDNNS